MTVFEVCPGAKVSVCRATALKSAGETALPSRVLASTSICWPEAAERLTVKTVLVVPESPSVVVWSDIEIVGWPVTVRQAENSEAFPAESVAVAVIRSPTGITLPALSAKLALPEASVLTLVEVRKVLPSPNPLPSHEGFEKTSIRYDLTGLAVQVPGDRRIRARVRGTR